MVCGAGEVEVLRLLGRPAGWKDAPFDAYGGVGAQPGDGVRSEPLGPSALTFNSALSPK